MKEDIKRLIEEAWQSRRGTFVGTTAGLALGLFILIFGFWRTAFVLFCGGIGLFVGRKVDRGEDFLRTWQEEWSSRLLNRNKNRNKGRFL